MSDALKRDLAAVLAEHQTSIRTNTPLDVLAGHLFKSLVTFETSLIERAAHPFYHPERPANAPPSADSPTNAAVHPVRPASGDGGPECGLHRDIPRSACRTCEEDD